MLQFVNAKINIGLRVLDRRPDGYHNLETIFYPIGLYNGTPENPEPFCDILEITPSEDGATHFHFTGRTVDCPLEKNLVYKAWALFCETALERGLELPGYDIRLEKHIPDGAGLGGGSADASFVLRMLNALNESVFSDGELAAMALKLGADCPFFIYNRPMLGEGVGEVLTPVDVTLEGKWLLLIKPDVYVSTKEAFGGLHREAEPAGCSNLLRDSVLSGSSLDYSLLCNDFEKSVFALHPVMLGLKERLYAEGAEFALMSGSGSSLYGIIPDRSTADRASRAFDTPVNTLIKL